jgi:hypothetical protein
MLRLILLVVFGFSLSNFFRAQTAEALVKNDWPNTVNAFGTLAEKESSHYIFVIDISDKRFGKDIVDQIEVFTEALPQNDKITIIQLGPTDETKEFVTTTDIDKEILQEIKRKLKSLVNEGKFGTDGSDGLKMTKLILKCLQASGTRNSLPFVYIFSDLEYYPYRNFPAVSEWIKCQTEYASLTFKYSPFIKSYILKNPDKSPRGDYKNYLNKIFPSMEIGDVDGPNLLKKEFSNIQADIYRKKLLNCLGKLVIDQNSHINLVNSDGNIVLNGTNLVYHKIILDDQSQSTVSKILNSELLFSFFPPTDVEIEVSGTLVAEKYKNEVSDLKDIPLSNQKITLKPGDSLIPWWLTDIIAILLLFSILRFIWTFFPPARLRGNIEFFTPSSPTQILDCAGKRKKFSNNDVKMLKSDFSIEIKATKKFFGGRCLILIPTNGDLLLISRKEKKTASRGKKTIAKARSQWSVDGIEIKMPDVK